MTLISPTAPIDASKSFNEVAQEARESRAQACYFEAGQELNLLLGWPVIVRSVPAEFDWRPLAEEASTSLSNKLELLGLSFSMAPLPITCDSLRQLESVPRLISWATNLPPDLGQRTLGGSFSEGPHLWLCKVGATVEHRELVKELFFETGPAIARSTRDLCVRIQALAEQVGADIRLMPPAAYWNALSLARLSYTRFKVQELERYGGALQISLKPGLAVVKPSFGAETVFELPDELEEDVMRALNLKSRQQAPDRSH